jgi:hypothetical protein
MFWMGEYTLRGEVGGGWALEFPSFLGPVKWERAPLLSLSTPLILPLQLGPLASPPLTPQSPPSHPPTPHPEFIRNQHQTVRCIKGRSGA